MAKPLIITLFISLSLMTVSMSEEPVRSKAHNINDRAVILMKISESALKVNTIQSDFIQEKHLQMMEKTIISKGLFFFHKPDKLRWEIIEPALFGFSVNGGKAKRWKGKKKRSQSFKISREPVLKVIIEQVFAWANADFKKLEKEYAITVVSTKPITLKLVPRNEQEQKFLDHLILSFTDGGSHVELVEVHEKDKDYTRIRFQNAVLNQTFQENHF